MDIEIEVSDLSKEFNRAASYITSVSLDVSVNDRLYLYSHYKQATEGECKTPKPGIFDFQGKAKWESWKNLKSMSNEEAMEHYIEKVAEIDPSWEASTPSKIGWVSVSTMMKELSVDDSEKNIFDFVQENNIEKIKSFPSEELNERDDNEMTLLHWACDRGYLELVKYLLEKTPQNLNVQENEGQTPLHYAVSCGHENVIQILLEHKADVNIKDHEGLLPIDLAQDETINNLLKDAL